MKNLFVLIMLTAGVIYAQAKVTTYSGSKGGGLKNGTVKEAEFKGAFGICIDHKGNIIIAENGNNLIRKITASGIVSVIAGSGKEGNKDGVGENALFNGPTGVCADENGNIFVADFLNHTIRKIDKDKNVTTIAGTGKPGYKNGKGNEASFNYPRGICLDKMGNIYVGDSWNHRIRKIDTEGNVTTYAGGGNYFNPDSIGEWLDARDTLARFNTPCGISSDEMGNIYVADARGHRIRKIDTGRNVTTIAGTGAGGPEAGGFKDGKAGESVLNTPTEVCAAPSGKIFFSDTYGNRVRMIFKGEVSTIAGSGKAGNADGFAGNAELNYPRGIAVDKSEKKIYFFDYNNNSLKIITLE